MYGAYRIPTCFLSVFSIVILTENRYNSILENNRQKEL